MATNKRLNPMDFSLKSYSKEELINEILIQRKIIAAYVNWKGDGHKPNKKKNNPLNLEINKGENESEYTAFFRTLSISLWMLGAIRKEDSNKFQEAFTPLGTTLNKCEWLLSKVLCVYLIEVLFDKKILHNHSDPQTAKNFGIKNSKSLRHNYHTNENKHPITNYGVPIGYDMIDEVVEFALKTTDTTPIIYTSYIPDEPETPIFKQLDIDVIE